MPEQSRRALPDGFNQSPRWEVREAPTATRRTGVALVAPGNRHDAPPAKQRRLPGEGKSRPAVNHHRPSVDVLFQSVRASAGSSAIGVLLTGMGADGAKDSGHAREGSVHSRQDEQTCVVFGMPERPSTWGGR